MNKYILYLLSSAILSHGWGQQNNISAVDKSLDAWHKAAAEANFEGYFGLMTADAIFIGTDATENWSYEAFRSFAKPYFDKGEAWDFSALERHVFFNESGDTAWFDELLDTWMGLCRGSGVLVKQEEGWKVKHYVLSLTIPNEQIDPVIALKKEKDSLIRKNIQRTW